MLTISNSLKPMSRGVKPINNTLKQKSKTTPIGIKTGAPNSNKDVLHCRIVRTYHKGVNTLIKRIPSKQKPCSHRTI